MPRMGSPAWWSLRSLRARPPGLAALDDYRHELFDAAMAQGEQLFGAAEQTPPPAQPLPIFYGLSQMGRALVAALDPTGPAVIGHGIKTTNLSGGVETAAVVGQQSPRSSFRAVSSLTGSPPLTAQATFSSLYSAHPGLVSTGLDWPTSPRALRVEYQPINTGFSLTITALAAFVIYDLPPEVQGNRNSLTSYLHHYPRLRGWSFSTDAPTPLQWINGTAGRGLRMFLRLDESSGDDEVRRDAVLSMTTFDGSGQPWLIPALHPLSEPLSPIMSWWALLFTLSMLARYEPVAWLRDLDVRRSRHATGLEALLDAALTEVPMLVLRTLHDAAS